MAAYRWWHENGLKLRKLAICDIWISYMHDSDNILLYSLNQSAEVLVYGKTITITRHLDYLLCLIVYRIVFLLQLNRYQWYFIIANAFNWKGRKKTIEWVIKCRFIESDGQFYWLSWRSAFLAVDSWPKFLFDESKLSYQFQAVHTMETEEQRISN